MLVMRALVKSTSNGAGITRECKVSCIIVIPDRCEESLVSYYRFVAYIDSQSGFYKLYIGQHSWSYAVKSANFKPYSR